MEGVLKSTLAADRGQFFTIEGWTPMGLTRFVVLFFIDLSTPRLEIGGIARRPDGLWMTQIARNVSDGVDGFFKGKRYLIFCTDNQGRLFGANDSFWRGRIKKGSK